MRASELIGTAVVDRNGQRVGQVTDLLLEDTAPRSICYALLTISNAPAAGQHSVAVPWALLEPANGGKQLTLAVSRDALRHLRAISGR